MLNLQSPDYDKHKIFVFHLYRARTIENANVHSQFRVTWKIKNFTRDYLKQCSKCTEIESDTFEIVVGKIRTKWALLLRPNGDNRKDKCLSVFLQKKQESSQDYHYSGQFSIVKNEKDIISWKFYARSAVNDAIGCGYGSLEFLSHDDMIQRFNDFVKDSQLIIRADIQLTAPKFLAEIFLNSSV